MKRLLFTFTALVAAVVCLAACNTGSPSAVPTVGPTCQPPSGTQTVLVYPAPGATGVVDSNGEIVIGSTAALDPTTWNIVILDANNPNGVQLPGTLAATSPPFPTPNATPPFANPQYQEQTAGVPIGANQVVTVYINNYKSSCAPIQIGQFST
jgi:hypothetical protein